MTEKCCILVYVHPREIDPGHPRMRMSFVRRFKSYVNLSTTYPKLELLCRNHSFASMRELKIEAASQHGVAG